MEGRRERRDGGLKKMEERWREVEGKQGRGEVGE